MKHRGRTYRRWIYREWTYLASGVAWFLTCCLVLACVARPSAAAPELPCGVAVEIVGEHPDAAELSDLAGELLAGVGNPTEDSLDVFLETAIERLRKTGLFSEIDIPDPVETPDGRKIVFRLTPTPRIRDIRISGAFPLLEREIFNVMTIAVGDRYRPDRLGKQEEFIRNLYEREGFPAVTVSLTDHPAGEAGTDRIIEVRVEKGAYTSVAGVVLEGATAFSGMRLKPRLKTWHASVLPGEGSRFLRRELDEDVKTLMAFYREHGYPEVEVTVAAEPVDGGEMLVRFTVKEGPVYDIEFAGNEAFWDMTLKDDLSVLETSGNRQGFGMKRALRNLRERYRDKGFPDAVISDEEAGKEDPEAGHPADDATRDLVIRIDEGTRSLVRSVAFTGVASLDESLLRDQMLTRPPGLFHHGGFSSEVLAKDVEAVLAVYARHGFRNASVRTDIAWEEAPAVRQRLVDVRLEVTEGTRTVVTAIHFQGLTLLEETDALRKLVLIPGVPYWKGLLDADITTMTARISEMGHPHVTVSAEAVISPDGSDADIRYDIDEGPEVRMGRVVFSGNFRTDPLVLEREVTVTPGEPLSLTRLLETERRLRDIQALDGADFRIVGLKEKDPEVHLLVTVAEKKPWYVEAGAGYDTERDFFANGRVGDRNLLGRNINVYTGFELSQIGYRLEAGLRDPRFLGTRISSALTAFTEEMEEKNQTFGRRASGAALDFQRKLGDHWTVSLGFRYEFREQYLIDGGTVPVGDEYLYEPRGFVMTTPSVLYDVTDSPIRPRKGVWARCSTDIATGLDNNLDDFLRYRLEARGYVSPLERLTLALRLRAGHIDPLADDDRVAEDQLFFLGGTSSIRGFKENLLRFDAEGDPLGGLDEFLGTLEARIELGMNLGLVLFCDAGTLRDIPEAGVEETIRFSAGGGLGYLTPIGPVSLYYGHKLDRKDGEDAGRIHLSIGYTF